jgi:hypothetical protein
MKKVSMLFALLGILCCANFVWAIPNPNNPDFSVTVGSYHDATINLGSTFSFDYWWDVFSPVGQGQPWAGLYLFDTTTGQQVTLWTTYQNQTSTQWQSSGSISIAAQYQGQQAIRWQVSDFGLQTPDPVVYIRNAAGNDPVPTPEPTTLLLLGLGMVGIAGWRRKFSN